MTVPDVIVGMVVAALPGATLWTQTETSPPFGDLLVFDGIVPPTPPQRYVVIYADDGTRTPGPDIDNMSVADDPTTQTHRWQTTSVAPDRQMASWLATRVRDALVGARPTVDGFGPGLVRHTFSQLPRKDERVLERPVMFAVDTYRLLAERLPATGS